MKNLLKVTDNFKNTNNFTVDCGICGIVNDDEYGNILNINNETKDYAHLNSKEQIKLKGGKTYCFSFLGKSAWVNSYVMVNNEWKTVRTDWTRCETILKPEKDEDYNFEITLSSQGHIWATQFQIEEGDKFTSFESGGQVKPVPPTPPAKKYGTITVQYVNYDTGITIANDYTIKGEVGTNYNIDKKDIDNYIFQYNTVDMNGTFTEGNKTIYLYYKEKETPKPVKKYGKVIIKYLDYDTSSEISNSDTLTGEISTSYFINTKDIFGYKYYSSQNSFSGVFAKEIKEIDLYYKKIEQPEPIPQDNMVEIVKDDKYEKALLITNKKNGIETITGETDINLQENKTYILSYYAKSDYNCIININGQKKEILSIGKEDSVTFVSKGNEKFILIIKIKDNHKIKFANFKIESKEEMLGNGKVIINYTDYDTNNILKSEIITGKIGASYKINAKQIDGYVFYYFGDSETGKFTNRDITITIFYRKQKQDKKYGIVDVEYIDIDTKAILSTATLKGEVGTKYIIEKKNFDNYKLESSEQLIGMFKEGKTKVILCYKKSIKPIKYGKVTIKYLDYNNQNSISSNTVLTGVIGNNYNVKTKNINGYIYETTYDNLNGVYSDYEQVITLYYKKNEEKPAEYGSVVVNYIDIDANREISNSDTLQGEVGTNYNATQKDINGYVYDYSSDGLNGIFTKTTKTIILYYRKQSQDKKYGKIIIEYIDCKTNKKICEDDVVTGEIGSKYNIQEKKINEYKYAYSYTSLSGNFVKENETIKLYYEKNKKPKPNPPIPTPDPEPTPSPIPVPTPVLQGTIATNQFTIIDMNDALITNLTPDNPTQHCLWLDTSVNPPILKIWNGYIWVVVNDYNDDIKDLQDQINNNQGQVVEQIKTVKETQSKDASDVQKLKDKITTLITHDDMTKITQTIGSRIDNVVVETNQNKQLITQTANGTKSELSGIKNKVTTIMDRQDRDNKKVSNEIKDLTNKNVTFEKTLDGVKGQISNVEIMTSNNLNETNTKLADIVATTDNIKGQLHSLDKKTVKEIDGVKDIVSQNTSGINILKDKVQSIVETTNTQEIQKLIDGKLVDVGKRIDSNSNRIEQAKTSLSAEISDIHGVIRNDMATKQDVSGLDSKVTKINADLNHVGANITHVTNMVNNIQIGGVNLIKDTKGIFVGDRNTYGVKTYNLPNLNGKTITISCKARVTKQGNNTRIRMALYNGAWTIGTSVYTKTNDMSWQTLNITWNVKTDEQLYLGFWNDGENNGGEVEIKEIMLEEGNKATTWQPSPMDVEGKIDQVKTQVASLDVSVNGINSKVGEKLKNVDDKLNGLNGNIQNNYTEINQLKDRVQNIIVNNNVEEFTKKINGQMDEVVLQSNKNKQWIETTGSGINRKIDGVQTEITQVKNKNGELEGKFNTVNNRTLEFKTTLDGFNGEIKSVKDTVGEKLNDVETRMTKIKATTNEFSTELNNISHTTDNIGRKVTESNSQIQQLSNKINEKVSEGNLSLEIQKRANAVQIAFNSINADIQTDKGIFSIKNGKFEVFDKENVNTLFIDDDGLVASNRGFGVYGKAWGKPDEKSGIHYSNSSIYQTEDDQPIYMHTDKFVEMLTHAGKRTGLRAGEAIFDTLWVGGSKHRIVKTQNFGTRALNAYETADCYFGDIGRNKLSNKQCIIPIDIVFKETVNTNIQYEVFVSPYGNGNVWVETKDMHIDHFIVRGTNDIEFAYEIKAKQRDYENDRLQRVNLDDK